MTTLKWLFGGIAVAVVEVMLILIVVGMGAIENCDGSDWWACNDLLQVVAGLAAILLPIVALGLVARGVTRGRSSQQD